MELPSGLLPRPQPTLLKASVPAISQVLELLLAPWMSSPPHPGALPAGLPGACEQGFRTEADLLPQHSGSLCNLGQMT